MGRTEKSKENDKLEGHKETYAFVKVIYGMNASIIGVTVDEICTPITPSRGKSALFHGDSPHAGCRVGPWIKPADSRALHWTPDSACWRRPA